MDLEPKIERSAWEQMLPGCCVFVAVANHGNRKKVTAHFGCGAKCVFVATTASSGERPEPLSCIPLLSEKCAEHVCGSGKRSSAEGGTSAEGKAAGKRGRPSFAENADTVGLFNCASIHFLFICASYYVRYPFFKLTMKYTSHIACLPAQWTLDDLLAEKQRSRRWRSCGMCARPTRGSRAR